MTSSETQLSAGAPPVPPLLAHKAPLLALVILSGIGVYVTDSFPDYGYSYWLGMGVAFAVFNLLTAWERNRAAGTSIAGILRVVVLHWAAFLAAVYVVFLIFRSGQVDAQTTGMMTLLALALTTFLAGVHLDWRLCLLGALLAGIVAGGAIVQRFLWMVLLPIGAAAALALYWWLRRDAAAAVPSAPPPQ